MATVQGTAQEEYPPSHSVVLWYCDTGGLVREPVVQMQRIQIIGIYLVFIVRREINTCIEKNTTQITMK